MTDELDTLDKQPKKQRPLRVVTRSDQGEPSWRSALRTNEEGHPTAEPANAAIILAHSEPWQGCLSWDEMRHETCWTSPPPPAPGLTRPEPGEWLDHHDLYVQHALRTTWRVKFSLQSIRVAVLSAAHEHPVHHIRAWLRSLRWDGTQRLPGFLARYFGCTDDVWSAEVGRRWMISAVARVMRPGCQADCMLILEGRQGRRKSTGLEALASTPWYCDTPLDLQRKDALECLRGKWIVELAELESFRGRDATRIKAFTGSRTDTFRESYGRRARDYPRACVLAGTTNERSYLHDPTGARRFWCVRVDRDVDTAAISADRSQLWAEALARFDSSENWWLDSEPLELSAEAEAEDRTSQDPWSDIIATWLAAPDHDHLRTEGVSAASLLTSALSMRPGDTTHWHVTRLGHVLAALGWRQSKVRSGSQRLRVYIPAIADPSLVTR